MNKDLPAIASDARAISTVEDLILRLVSTFAMWFVYRGLKKKRISVSLGTLPSLFLSFICCLLSFTLCAAFRVAS